MGQYWDIFGMDMEPGGLNNLGVWDGVSGISQGILSGVRLLIYTPTRGRDLSRLALYQGLICTFGPEGVQKRIIPINP